MTDSTTDIAVRRQTYELRLVLLRLIRAFSSSPKDSNQQRCFDQANHLLTVTTDPLSPRVVAIITTSL
jgi:hypothetical protein